MKVLCIFVSLIVVIKAGYHEEIGIPLAARIKAYEDRIFAGGRESNLRNVGGDVSPVFAHPYLVGLIIRLTNDFVSTCGSSLITATRLVTAAHCIDFGKSIKAVIGSQYLYHGGERVITMDFRSHPHFNESISLDYDIGIVNLPQPVEITETVHTISLPNTPDEAEVIGEWAVTAGWGVTKDADRGKKKDQNLVLSEVRLQIAPENVCGETYQSYGNVKFTPAGNYICTSGAEGGGVCDGDDGGPLVVDRNGNKILVGVVSTFHKPCDDNKPSVFTRVVKFKDFILQP